MSCPDCPSQLFPAASGNGIFLASPRDPLLELAGLGIAATSRFSQQMVHHNKEDTA